MTIPERIAGGYRRCECKDVFKFKLEKKYLGGNKNLKRYMFLCSQCGTFYFSAETEEDVMEALVLSGIEIESEGWNIMDVKDIKLCALMTIKSLATFLLKDIERKIHLGSSEEDIDKAILRYREQINMEFDKVI